MADKAMGLRRTKVGWQVVEYTIEKGKVVEEKATEPDVRALIVEKFKKKIVDMYEDFANG